MRDSSKICMRIWVCNPLTLRWKHHQDLGTKKVTTWNTTFHNVFMEGKPSLAFSDERIWWQFGSSIIPSYYLSHHKLPSLSYLAVGRETANDSHSLNPSNGENVSLRPWAKRWPATSHPKSPSRFMDMLNHFRHLHCYHSSSLCLHCFFYSTGLIIEEKKV